MDDISESAAKHVSSTTPEPSSGFASFWKKSKKSKRGVTTQIVQFVPEDPGSKGKPNQSSRMSEQGHSASTPTDQSDGSLQSGTAEKRRRQVYQAQKRHRNRKADYVQSLEAELARLQHLDAIINSEKNTMAYENEAMKALLAQHSVDTQLDSATFNAPPSSSGKHSMLGSAAIDIRYDPEIGHERTFMEFANTTDLPSESASNQRDGKSRERAQHAPVKGDSSAALDFILALEWPCRDHIQHHGINPDAKTPVACQIGQFHGHALTTTKAVYSSALPPDTSNEHGMPTVNPQQQDEVELGNMEKWQLPHSEIDKLVELSEQLPLDDEQMTPAQAYAAVRREVPKNNMLRPVLNALKAPLASLVECLGLGSVLPANAFYQHLDVVLQNLGLAEPGLEK